jgi:hypothetical protein
LTDRWNCSCGGQTWTGRNGHRNLFLVTRANTVIFC